MRLTPVPPTPPIPLPPPRPAPLSPPSLHAAPPAHYAVTGPALPDDLLQRLLDHRIVPVGGDIDDAVASRVTAQLLLLAAEDPRGDVTVHLLSDRGSATAAMAIHDTMRLIPCEIATWSLGITAGVAPFLLAAGTPGRRHALPHARIRLSRPRGGGLGEEIGRELAELTVGRDAPVDRWLAAAEARTHGLVDHVA